VVRKRCRWHHWEELRCLFPWSECIACHEQWHADSKTLLQENPPVLIVGCWLPEVYLYNGCKIVVCVCGAS